MKLNLWPLFFGSVLPLPFVVTATTHYGWVIAWMLFCLFINIINEVYHFIKKRNEQTKLSE